MQGLEKRFGVSKVVFEKLQVIYPGEKLQTTNYIVLDFTIMKNSGNEKYSSWFYIR